MKEMEELTSCKTAIENCKTSGTFAAADGIIDLIAVMDVHVHGFFFFI